MKAALWYGQKDVRIEEVEMPVAKKGEVIIKVKWCGICGTDLHEYLAGPIFIPTEPNPTTGVKAPVILGHEFSGEVIELGEGVTHLAVGDAVVVEPLLGGDDWYTRRGENQLSDTLAFHGLQDTGGGFAEYTSFRADRVKKLPERVSYEMGALVEPMAVALHALEMGEFKAKQTAVVVGAGPIGLGIIENLKACGARRVFAVELSETRKEKAKVAGADFVFDPREVDIVAEVKKLTNGLGADISFEVTGVQPGLETAMRSIRKLGTCVVVAIWETEAKMNLFDVVMSEKKVVGIVCYNEGTFETTAQFMADGRIKATDYATSRIHLDDLAEKGFGALTGPDRDREVKVLVTPDKSLI